jgi:predicted TIM-barrel fold metal-dependent hydrolase
VTEPDRSVGFVDAHVHLWELGRLRYGWLEEPGIDVKTAYLGDYRALREDWGPARLAGEFEGSNVVKAVHIEADQSGPDPVEETAWLASVAARWGMPNAIVAYADLQRDGVETTLDRHLAASALVRGIRIREHPADPTGGTFRRGLRALALRGLSYDVNAQPDRLASARATARQEPDLQLILCHTGDPPRRDQGAFATWRLAMRELAELPNVACKISGLGMGDHGWTVDSIRPWVLETIDAFGVERCMFATNWPVDSLYGTYRRQVDAYRTIVAEAGFSAGEQRALLAGNADRFYRIERSITPSPRSPDG